MRICGWWRGLWDDLTVRFLGVVSLVAAWEPGLAQDACCSLLDVLRDYSIIFKTIPKIQI